MGYSMRFLQSTNHPGQNCPGSLSLSRSAIVWLVIGWCRRARARGWMLASTLAVAAPSLAMAPYPAFAAASRPEAAAEAEALLAQADADRAAGHWADAASAFDRAYRRLPISLVAELGESTVLLAVEAYEKDAAAEGGTTASLQLALELVDALQADLRELDPQWSPSATLQQTRARLVAALPEPEQDSERAPEPAAVVVDTPEPPPDVLGWTLVGTGTAVVVGGIAVLIRGSRMLPIAKERLAERGPDLMNPAADDAYLEENRRRGRILMGVGGVLSAAGLAAVIVGAIRVSRRRAAPTQARLQAAPGGLRVRF